MSRIGKRPIPVPSGVKVNIKGSLCELEGPKGKLAFTVPNGVQVKQAEGKLQVSIPTRTRELQVMFGTTRAHLNNMVAGVTQGFQKSLEISGVGYKAEVDGKNLVLTLGFTHTVKVPIPEGVQVKVEKQTMVSISGTDRQKVGNLASVVRHIRPADPYKEKGVKYSGEVIRRKAGKATVAKAA